MQNLMQIQSALEQLPDPQLQQYMHGTNPNVPQFMVLMEMNRRVQERQAQQQQMAAQQGQQQPPTTVAQDVGLAALGGPRGGYGMQMQQAQGQPPAPQRQLTQMPAPPQQGGVPAVMQPQGEGFVDGGIVGYDDGGAVEDDSNPLFMDPSDMPQEPDPDQRYMDTDTLPEGTPPAYPSKADLKARTQAAPAAPADEHAPSWLTGQIFGRESGNNDNIGHSVNGAVGPGQIMPATFAQFAKPGEDINNPVDNRAVAQRMMDSYWQQYHDPARVKVAYFSGPGNVAPPGSPTPWKNDVADGNGTTVSQYVYGGAGNAGKPAGTHFGDAIQQFKPLDMGVRPMPIPDAPVRPDAPAMPTAGQTVDLGDQIRGHMTDVWTKQNDIADAARARAQYELDNAGKDALTEQSAGILASKSPFTFQALGEGMQQALHGERQQRQEAMGEYDKADDFSGKIAEAQAAAEAGDYRTASQIMANVGQTNAAMYGHQMAGYGADQAARAAIFGHNAALQTGMAQADARGDLATARAWGIGMMNDARQATAEAQRYRTASSTLAGIRNQVQKQLMGNINFSTMDPGQQAQIIEQESRRQFASMFPNLMPYVGMSPDTIPQASTPTVHGVFDLSGNLNKPGQK